MPVLQASFDFLLLIPVPYEEKDISFWCQFQKVSIEPFNVSIFGISGNGIDLDYYDIECFVLEMNQNHSVFCEISLKDCILDSFADCECYSISSKGFLPTVVDIMVI